MALTGLEDLFEEMGWDPKASYPALCCGVMSDPDNVFANTISTPCEFGYCVIWTCANCGAPDGSNGPVACPHKKYRRYSIHAAFPKMAINGCEYRRRQRKRRSR